MFALVYNFINNNYLDYWSGEKIEVMFTAYNCSEYTHQYWKNLFEGFLSFVLNINISNPATYIKGW